MNIHAMPGHSPSLHSPGRSAPKNPLVGGDEDAKIPRSTTEEKQKLAEITRASDDTILMTVPEREEIASKGYAYGHTGGKLEGVSETKAEHAKRRSRWGYPLIAAFLGTTGGAGLVALWAHYHDKKLMKRLQGS